MTRQKRACASDFLINAVFVGCQYGRPTVGGAQVPLPAEPFAADLGALAQATPAAFDGGVLKLEARDAAARGCLLRVTEQLKAVLGEAGGGPELRALLAEARTPSRLPARPTSARSAVRSRCRPRTPASTSSSPSSTSARSRAASARRSSGVARAAT